MGAHVFRELGLPVHRVYFSTCDGLVQSVNHTNFPDAENIGFIEQINVKLIKNIVEKDKDAVFVLFGSVPTNNNSSTSYSKQFCRILLAFRMLAGQRVIAFCDGPPSDDVVCRELTRITQSPGYQLCSRHWGIVTRPRRWWINGDQQWEAVAPLAMSKATDIPELIPEVDKHDIVEIITNGWKKMDENYFFTALEHRQPTSTTLRTLRSSEGCTYDVLQRWRDHDQDQAPIHYRPGNMVVAGRQGARSKPRRLIADEAEKMYGLPMHFTASIINEEQVKDRDVARQNLVAKAWHANVFKIILKASALCSLCARPAPTAAQEDTSFCPSQQQFPSSFMTQAVEQEVWDNYTSCIKAHAEVLHSMSKDCPYNQYRAAKGIRTDVASGPDYAELNAARAAAIAGGLQLRHMSNAAQPERLVPKGLDPHTHAQLGMAVRSPLDEDSSISDDLNFACHIMSSVPNYGEWQRRQLRKLKGHLKRVKGLGAFYGPLRSQSSLLTCPSASPENMDAIARSMAWPDLEVPWMAVVGSPVVGDLPKTGIFREAEVDQVTTIEDFLKDADQWHQDLVEFLLSLFPLFFPWLLLDIMF